MSMLGSVTQLTGTNVEAQRQEPFPLAKFPHFPGDGDGTTYGAVITAQ